MRPYPCAILVAAFLAAGRPPAQTARNCELLSHKTRPGVTAYYGIWGYVAPNGREFAAVACDEGTWIVETTDPRNPVERAFFTGGALQRNVAGYKEYFYSVAESLAGVHIISMKNPDAPEFVTRYAVTGWHNTHTVSVDQKAGVLYCNGTYQGLRIFDISQDPTRPVPITIYTGTYVHDTFAQNGFAYFSCLDAGLRIMDVRALPAITQLGATMTPLAFTHNTWANSTDTIAVTTDEKPTGFLQVYDVRNKAAPVKKGSYSVPGSGIHNAHIVDDKVVHMSFYNVGGYRAADITDPDNPREIGYYTTEVAFGVYPYQPSGNVYVSARPPTGGLYIVRLTCGVPERYGAGTRGTAGKVPHIDWDGGHARVGNPRFRLELENALAGAPSTLVLGLAPANVKLLGIDFLLDPALLAVFLPVPTGPGGTASLTLPIPPDRALANAFFFAQWFVVDRGGPQGLAASRGMKVTVCP